mgnify:CR=1 FL=1
MTASAERRASRPQAVDLFAGAGGMSLGFEQAGFDVRAAVEVDPVHCAVHEFNFPDCAVLARSVVGLTAADVREAAGIGDGPVDCVFGGPPCQGFSLMGLRALDDPRNKLVLEFVRLVAELGARSFVFENVKGLTAGDHKRFLSEIVEAFSNAGYQVALPWRVLDAADYGVPQHRERLILMGTRRGETLPEYPAPLVAPADGGLDLRGLPVGPTCRDALGDIPDADDYDALIDSDKVRPAPGGASSDYARQLRCRDDESWHHAHPRRWDHRFLTSSIRTDHSEISRRRFAETAPGSVEPISRFFKLAPDGLCNTLRAGTDGARGAFTSPRPIHYEHPRCVTVREMARLHGLPDWFRLHSTKWHGARQIGNSVPPPLARAVAVRLLEALGFQPTRPQTAVPLGDEPLLYMVAAEAARHYGIDARPGRRDRKSGAKKRTQFETEVARLAAREALLAK